LDVVFVRAISEKAKKQKTKEENKGLEEGDGVQKPEKNPEKERNEGKIEKA